MKIVIIFFLLVFHLIPGLLAQDEFVESDKAFLFSIQYSIRPIDLRSGDHWYYRDYTLGLGYAWKDKFAIGLNVGQLLKDPKGPFRSSSPAAKIFEPYVAIGLFKIDLSQSGDASNGIRVTGNFSYRYNDYAYGADSNFFDKSATAKTIGISFFQPFMITKNVSITPKVTMNFIFNSVKFTSRDWYPEERFYHESSDGRKLQLDLGLGIAVKTHERFTLGIKPRIRFTQPIDAPGFGLPNEENATYSLELVGVFH